MNSIAEKWGQKTRQKLESEKTRVYAQKPWLKMMLKNSITKWNLSKGRQWVAWPTGVELCHLNGPGEGLAALVHVLGQQDLVVRVNPGLQISQLVTIILCRNCLTYCSSLLVGWPEKERKINNFFTFSYFCYLISLWSQDTPRVGIKKPTQKNPPKKTQKNPPKKKPTKNGFFLGFLGFFKFFIFLW